MSSLHWLYMEHLLPPWISVAHESVLCTERMKARGCKPTRMRSCFLMGRQQSMLPPDVLWKLMLYLPSNYKNCGSVANQISLFWWTLCWSRWPWNEKFVCWVNRLYQSQTALFSTQCNKSTYLEETSAIPHFVFSDQEIPAITHNYHSRLLIKYQNLLTNKVRCSLFTMTAIKDGNDLQREWGMNAPSLEIFKSRDCLCKRYFLYQYEDWCRNHGVEFYKWGYVEGQTRWP